jgi:hypothetical protein
MRQAASALRPEVLCGFVPASFTTEARRSLLGGSRGWAKRQRCILEFHALQHLARRPCSGENADVRIRLGLYRCRHNGNLFLALSKYDFRIRPRFGPGDFVFARFDRGRTHRHRLSSLTVADFSEAANTATWKMSRTVSDNATLFMDSPS